MIKTITNLSLQAKIALAFMVMVLIILTVFGTFFYSNTADTIRLSKQGELNLIALETADKVDRFIFERFADIQVLSDSKVLTMEGIDEKTKLDYLDNVIKAYQTYKGILVQDSNGSIQLSSGKIPKIQEVANMAGSSLPLQTKLLESHEEGPVFLISRSLTGEQGTAIGSVTTIMGMELIETIVENVKIGDTGYAELTIGEPLIPSDQVLLVSVPVSQFQTNAEPWYINVMQDQGEAYKLLNDFLRYLLLISAVSIVLLSFFSILLSRIITEPIRRLMDKTSQMMHTSDKKTSQTESKNEITTLNTSFNSLLEQLNFMMQMVLEKTGEAADINDINENIRETMESIPNGILTIDASGQISSMNLQASQILHLDSTVTKRRSIFQPDRPELAAFFEILINSLKNDHKYNGEICYIQTESGEAVPIVFNTLRQTDQNGELIGMTVIMNLLAEKKRREEMLLRARRLSELGQMAAGVAHEIRNPLASIKGYAQYARLEFNESQQTFRDLTVILNEVERLNLIVERFMHFAQPNKPVKKQVSAGELIESTIKLMKNDFEHAKVRLLYQGNYKSNIFVDPDQFKQVLINLLINSLQASSPGDDISILTTVDIEERAFCLEITDQGTGISEEQIERIFTPFYTTKEKGTGLGLSISNRIIENHGGTLEITNNVARGVKALIKVPLEGDHVDAGE